MKIHLSFVLWILMAVVVAGQAKPHRKTNNQPNADIKSDCAGSHMTLTVDEVLAVGNQLEIEATNGSEHILLTPGLAAKCGYSMESDPWGNTRIYTSLMGCYVDNTDDTFFNIGLRLKMYSDGTSDVVTRDVTKTCSYSAWASQEIVCDRNYMEISKDLGQRDASPHTKGHAGNIKDDLTNNAMLNVNDTAYGIWKMTFYTPEPTVMMLDEVHEAGYGAMTSPNRLVVRSPYNTAQTYSEDVAGVPMEVVKVGTYFTTPQGLRIVDLIAACPIGGVTVNDGTISWNIPRYITPLLTGRVKILEMHMGINGKRLDKAQRASRGYTLSSTEYHLVIELPIGSPDGYFKSHAPDYQYHLSYTVEPMLELLWIAKDTQSDTRYKVLFPITTPLMPWYPDIADETIPEEGVFKVKFGTLLHDVNLVNITFSTGVLSAAECNAKGFLQEQKYSNGSKVYLLQVPFSDDVVLKHNPDPLLTAYFLPLTYGFMVMPEETPFSYSLAVDASLNDVVLPSVFGTCDDATFFITVKYGSQGRNFETMLGTQMLTPELGRVYGQTENGTHLSLSLPYTSLDVAFELFDTASVKARLDVLLWEPINNWSLREFSLACNFPLTTTKCYSNGTMTALSVKLESVPNLVPHQLTLRDKSCKPYFSDDRFAHFSFNVNACGTSRVFFGNYLLYENDISLDYSAKAFTSPVEPDFRHTVSCYYLVNDMATLEFDNKPLVNIPSAEIGTGQLMVEMRLALDESYELFYQAQDYPVQKYLRQPAYFEVALLHSANPQLELILDNCWATLQEERTSLPRWDIIVDGCENLEDRYITIFHPVVSDQRVVVPSLFKRFSVKVFSFVKDKEVLQDEIYVHCDAVICDLNAGNGVCSQCRGSTGVRQPVAAKGQRVQRSTTLHKWQISSGPVRINFLK
ncbi:unnamed protein product [Arctogadus glacialis]